MPLNLSSHPTRTEKCSVKYCRQPGCIHPRISYGLLIVYFPLCVKHAHELCYQLRTDIAVHIVIDIPKADLQARAKNEATESLTPTALLPQTFPLPSYGTLYTLKDFISLCNDGTFMDYDGTGYYSINNRYTASIVSPSDVLANRIDKRYTHVLWFNR